MKQAIAHHELADVFEAAAHTAMHKRGLRLPAPVRPRRVSDDGKTYDRAPPATIDDIYADTGFPMPVTYSNDLLRDMHKDGHERVALSEDKNYIRNCFEQILLDANKMLGFVGAKVKPDEVVALCSNIADTAVANAILFGNDKESLGFAKEFLREFRRELAQEKGFDEALAVRLKRCEDKLDIGLEAVDVVAKKVHFPKGQRDFFDRGLALHMQRAYGKTPAQQTPSEDDIKQAGEWSCACYSTCLDALGIRNDGLHAVTPYSFALLQRGVHVAEAEFMRLPHSSPFRQLQVAEGRMRYNTQRVPVLLNEALQAFPPVLAQDANDQPISKHTCYMHNTDRLFGALAWLDAKRAQVAQRGCA